MNKYKNKTLYRLIPIKAAILFFLSKVASYFFSLCFVVLALNYNNSVDSVIVFYIIPSFTHSSLVLNLNGIVSSAEHKCYFREGGKPNCFWSSVTYIVFFSFYQSQCGPATVWFSTFFKIPYFVFSTRKKGIQVWDNMWVSKYNDRNTIVGWTIPLMTVGCMFSSVPLRPARI